MPSELASKLHPDCTPVAWMLGSWRGNGHGHYPTIEKFHHTEELVVSHDGRPFLSYVSRAWLIDDHAEKIRPAASESGFLRCRPGGEIEMVLAHSTGVVEVWSGRMDGRRLELVTDSVARTGSAKEYVGGRRHYELLDGDLVWSMDMAAVGEPIQPHLWTRLKPD
ncbi:FABP family protein [Georgenia alba]|uniref:Peroxynitrite isomerase n=1 Tax=Georgenia alba TaxID=2233858 RepID=A0ABW2QAW9_9MICO